MIVRGQHQQALRVLQKAARWNKVTLPGSQHLITTMKKIQKKVKEKFLLTQFTGLESTDGFNLMLLPSTCDKLKTGITHHS